MTYSQEQAVEQQVEISSPAQGPQTEESAMPEQATLGNAWLTDLVTASKEEPSSSDSMPETVAPSKPMEASKPPKWASTEEEEAHPLADVCGPGKEANPTSIPGTLLEMGANIMGIESGLPATVPAALLAGLVPAVAGSALALYNTAGTAKHIMDCSEYVARDPSTSIAPEGDGFTHAHDETKVLTEMGLPVPTPEEKVAKQEQEDANHDYQSRFDDCVENGPWGIASEAAKAGACHYLVDK